MPLPKGELFEVWLILVGVGVLLFGYTFFIHVWAEPVADLGKIVVKPASDSMKGKGVAVMLSKTCIALAKAGLSNDYPTYKDLIQFDTSNKKYSGEFADYNGYYHRLPTKHGFGIYRFDDTYRVFVDAPSTYKIPVITIQCNALAEFHLPTQYKVHTNNTAQVFERAYSSQRYVNPSCDYATITGKNWAVIVPDTIKYLQSDCTITNLNTEHIAKKDVTKHDIGTTNKLKLDSYYKTIKNTCAKQLSINNKCSVPNNAVLQDENQK